MQFRQLIPGQGTVEERELLSRLALGDRAPQDRPFTIANFVTTVDGHATFQGRSGPLGDEGDRAIFHGLREHVDAVLAGTGTLRIERYGRLLAQPERRRRRAERDVTPEPLACVVTRSGEVPTAIPLFEEPEARVLIFSPIEIDTAGAVAQVEVVHLDPGELTLTTVLRRLRRDHHVRALLCEGGPTLFGALLAEGLVDELFLTLTPKLAGGGPEPTMSSGPALTELEPLSVQWLLERAGSLYLRYALH
ncbi:MAG: dihydrofolate reductase family protein [Solirubrobacteraceae bacterium]